MPFSSILKGAGGVTTGFTSDMFKQIFWFICDCIIFISFYFILLFKQKKYSTYQYK